MVLAISFKAASPPGPNANSLSLKKTSALPDAVCAKASGAAERKPGNETQVSAIRSARISAAAKCLYIFSLRRNFGTDEYHYPTFGLPLSISSWGAGAAPKALFTSLRPPEVLY